MSGRDVHTVYKTREIPEGYHPRIPTALDPYDHPYDRQPTRRARSVRERDSGSNVDPASVVSIPRSIESTFRVDSKRGSKEALVDIGRSGQRDRSTPRTIKDNYRDSGSTYRRSVIVDQESDPRYARRLRADYQDSALRGSRDELDVDYGRAQNRSREYIIDDSVNRSQGILRHDGKAYVMDTQGEVDVIMPGRDRDRDRSNTSSSRYRHTPESRYHSGNGHKNDDVIVIVSPREQKRSDASLPRYMQPPRNRHYRQGDYKNRAREIDIEVSRRDDDRDDDWRIIDSMRDTHLSTTGSDRRSRAPTQSSEDSFVMVSPTQDSGQTIRSAMRGNHAPAELRRRRSRSISFRDSETISHNVGDRRHERPGAEAEICGLHLRRRRSEQDNEIDFDQRESKGLSRQRRPRRETDERYDDRREPYSPQVAPYPNRERSRSRRRRYDDDDDDASYYSQRVDTKYVKETRYV